MICYNVLKGGSKNYVRKFDSDDLYYLPELEPVFFGMMKALDLSLDRSMKG